MRASYQIVTLFHSVHKYKFEYHLMTKKEPFGIFKYFGAHVVM